MVWTDEVGPVRLASGMPEKIVQGAQYMNDAMGSVFGKFTQSFNSEKSTSEFRGGIWDCNPIKETVSPESSCRNNLSNKTFSLDEILACDEDTEMKETDDLISSQNKSADLSANASFSDMSIDVNNKRWRSASLLPCNDSETTRKKSKKTVSFSDTVIDLEDSFKPSGKTSISLAFGVPAVEDVSSSLIKNVLDERMNNSVTLVSEKVDDISTKMEDKGSAHEKKSVKVNTKVKNWKKLMSQSSEIDFHDKQPCEQIPIDVASSKKLSREKQRNRKTKSDSAEHETVTKKIVDNQKLKNEELMNRSHLEKSIPELFQLIESKTEDETEPRSMKNVKEKNVNIRKLALEKETSQTLKKDSDIDVDLIKEVKSKTSEEIESAEDRLKSSLLEMLGDSVMAESFTNHIKKLAEQKKIVDASEKDEIVSDNQQIDFIPKIRRDKSPEEKSVKEQTCHVGKVWSEDESQYELESTAIQTKKNCCPPVCDKPSCNQSNFEKSGKVVTDLVNDIALKLNTNGTDNKSGKVSPTSYQNEKLFRNCNSISSSRSDSFSNWRSQCIDVRSKDEEKATLQNWRNDCSNLRNHKTRVENWKNRQENKLDLSSIEYVDDGMVVLPVYTKEPPSDPLSRFKDIKTDPESIWDACEEKSKPSRASNQIQLQGNDFDQKNASAADVHAQLFRKTKTTSIPRFFDNPTRTFVPSKPDEEYTKHPSQRKIDSSSSGMFNENYRSRSQSRQGNFPHHRSFERNRSSSTHWRSSLSAATLEHDVFYMVKISSPEEDKVEKLRILKEDFLTEVRGNSKLSDLIPSPGYKPKKIPYSASAVTIFVRCIFSLSFKIPSWKTALEAFVLAKKFGIEELKKYCEDYFTNFKIPSEPVKQVATYAHQLHAVDAFKSSKFFHKIKDFRSISTQYEYTPQSCTVSCSVLVDPSELEIPLLSEITRGLESCNVSDVRNRLFFKSLTHETCLTGIQLKFLTEDVHTQLKIECEVKGDSPEKLFYKYLEEKAKSSIKISFDEITVGKSKEIEIVVCIEDVLLKVCPQLMDDKLVGSGQFHARFESSKTHEKKMLFCIEKLFYTTSQAW